MKNLKSIIRKELGIPPGFGRIPETKQVLALKMTNLSYLKRRRAMASMIKEWKRRERAEAKYITP